MSEPKTGANGAKQGIDELQKRYQKLNTKKIQAETNLDNAAKQLEKLKEEAREKYGTDDVGQLRKQLAAMTAENEAKRSEYQIQLDRIEGDLAAVETKFAAAEQTAAGDEKKG